VQVGIGPEQNRDRVRPVPPFVDRGLDQGGDRVGFLGIGSGLNCLMLGLEW